MSVYDDWQFTEFKFDNGAIMFQVETPEFNRYTTGEEEEMKTVSEFVIRDAMAVIDVLSSNPALTLKEDVPATFYTEHNKNEQFQVTLKLDEETGDELFEVTL